MYRNSRLVIGPNASLDRRGALIFLGLLGLGTLPVSIWLALKGLWLILPFAGLELAAVGLALWVCLRRNAYREVLSFEGDRVAVEFGMVGRGASARVDLPRQWARVVLEPGLHRNDYTSLQLRCSGQQVEIGRCLTDEEREQLAARIQELLKPDVRLLAGKGKGDEPAGFSLGDQ